MADLKASLRIVVVLVDSGAAANVGGPVHSWYRTFDVPCPDELADLLENRPDKYCERSIVGVEVRRPSPGEGDGR